MLTVPPAVKLWYCPDAVDMRLGFDGLFGLVKSRLNADPLSGAVLYSVVGTCKHLGIDPFAYLRDALPGVFALGEKPRLEQLLDWLPDRWLLNRTRDQPVRDANAG